MIWTFNIYGLNRWTCIVVGVNFVVGKFSWYFVGEVRPEYITPSTHTLFRIMSCGWVSTSFHWEDRYLIPITCNCKYSWCWGSSILKSDQAGERSIMGLSQRVDGEVVRWCTSHGEVSTSSNGFRATWPYPLYNGGPHEIFWGSNSAGEGIGLASCLDSSWCNGDQRGDWKEEREEEME